MIRGKRDKYKLKIGGKDEKNCYEEAEKQMREKGEATYRMPLKEDKELN
jgi:hypothetical protein